MNLGGDGFLYLTPADGHLSVRTLGDMPTSANGEWRATAVDSSIALRVDGTLYRGGQLTIDYSGAPANAWISVLPRAEDGNNLAYGCLGQSMGGSGWKNCAGPLKNCKEYFWSILPPRASPSCLSV